MVPLLAGRQPEIDELPAGDSEGGRMAALAEAISSYAEHSRGGSVRMVGRRGDTIVVGLDGASAG